MWPVGPDRRNRSPAAHRQPSSALGWPAAEEVHGFDLHDHLIVLVQHFAARADDAPVGSTARQLGFDHGESPAQRVAGSDRFEPTQVVDARRAETLTLANYGIDEQTHECPGGMPAAGNQPTVDRTSSRVEIRMH